MPFTVRTVFIIDPKAVIRCTFAYPASTGSLTSPLAKSYLDILTPGPGRNFPELLRVIDSLQLGDKHKVSHLTFPIGFSGKQSKLGWKQLNWKWKKKTRPLKDVA